MRLLQDFRDGVRSLKKSPVFSLIAILTLAVGIGAVTALFNVVDGVLLKPLRYPDADRIVSVVNQYADRTAPNLAGGDEVDIAAERGIFEAFAYYHGGEMGVQVAGHAEFVGARLVHPDFFRVFGIAPLAGQPLANVARAFQASESTGLRSAVVSLGFAVRNFGSADGALNKSVFIESRSYEIVGVMPPAMQFPANTDVWAAAPVVPDNHNRTGHNYRSVARLARGVSLDAANDRLSVLAERLAVAFPVSNRGKTFRAIPLRDALVSQVRTTLYVLLGAVGLVLLIACANVANLMLARGSARAREVAVRIALGAARRHIISQLLVESIILASIACALGVLLAYTGTGGLLRLGASYVPLPRLNEITMDWRVLGFSVAVSLFTAVAFGLAPAAQASRTEVKDALSRCGSRGAIGGGPASSRLRAGLVVAQIALSYMLAIDAGLLVRSFVSLTEAPLGFRSNGVLVMYAHAPARGSIFDNSGLEAYLRAGRLFDDVLMRVRQLPSVIAAGGAMGLPTGQYDSNGAYAVEGKHTFTGDFRKLPSAGFRLASPGYFETLNIPLMRGRDFNEGDVYDRPSVAIISQSLAQQTFGAEDPLGHRIMCGLDRPDQWMTIVGVVGDVRQASPASQPGPELYMPLRQHPYTANEVQVVVRTRVPPESLTGTVQQIVRASNPDVAMKFTTLEQSVNASIASPRFRALLVSAFASLALLLAIAGIYAVMSYMTAQRMAEFGLRMALGAGSRDVVRLVLARAGRLAIIGAAIGLALAVASGRIVSSMLYGIAGTDLVTYGAVLVTAMPLVVAAAAVPALRAARVDPIVALENS
jgi:putative ABC transport system permease protein